MTPKKLDFFRPLQFGFIYLVNLTDKAILEGENTDLSEWRDFLKNGTINPKSSRGLKEAQK